MGRQVIYSIADWSEHFEVNRTKELKHMTWVPIPNKQDGDGYTELLDHPNGAAHFGAWVALIQVASKCDPRGTLLRDERGGVRRPHDAASLGRITRVPAAVFVEVLPRLITIGWLTATPCPAETCGMPEAIPHVHAASPQEDAASRAGATEHGTEGKGGGGSGREGGCGEMAEPSAPPPQPPAALLSFPCVGDPPFWSFTADHVEEWGKLFPDMDVHGEARRAYAWVTADTKRRKTAGGMRKFLVAWFGKSVERGTYLARSNGSNGRASPPLPLGATEETMDRFKEVERRAGGPW